MTFFDRTTVRAARRARPGRRALWLVSYLLAATLLLALQTGCDGKECTDRPDSAKSQKELMDKMEDVLDDADISSAHEQKLLKLASSLKREREKLAAGYEPVRAKILAEVLQPKPDVQKLDGLIDQAALPMMAYAHRLVSVMLVGHAILTPAERGRLVDATKDFEDGDYKTGFFANRGFDLFLWRLGVKGAQEIRIREMKADVESNMDRLAKSQKKRWLSLTSDFKQAHPDPTVLNAKVDGMGQEIIDFTKGVAATFVAGKSILHPDQRHELDGYLVRLRRCPVNAK